MKFTDNRSKRILRREFFKGKGDPYHLKEFVGGISHIVDIGANVGLFSVGARFLCPPATIVAIEPDPRTYELLCDNVSNLLISTEQGMLGPSGRGTVRGGGASVSRTAVLAEEGFVSLPLYEWVPDPMGRFIKIDCEGGEHCILECPKSINTLRNCAGFSIEIHGEFKKWQALLSSFNVIHMGGRRMIQATVDNREKQTLTKEKAL